MSFVIISSSAGSRELMHFDIIVYGPGNTEAREHRIVSSDEINNSEEPWANKVRYIDPRKAEK